MEETKETKCTCIECGKSFDKYPYWVCCRICDGEGYIEADFDDFMRDDFRKCWQCNGDGELTLMESAFCDDECRENHFDNDVD